MSRVYGEILKNSFEKKYLLMEAAEQASFRKRRFLIDHILSLDQTIERITSQDQEIHQLFLDLKKPYESVPLKNLGLY